MLNLSLKVIDSTVCCSVAAAHCHIAYCRLDINLSKFCSINGKIFVILQNNMQYKETRQEYLYL